jgi:hypothetical protein
MVKRDGIFDQRARPIERFAKPDPAEGRMSPVNSVLNSDGDFPV